MTLISHGIDLVDIERVAAMLDEHGTRFRDRCFTAEEQAYAEQAAVGRAERYAARFACKEAVLKALGTGWRDGIRWTDIAVRNEPSGRPVVSVHGRCAEIAGELGIERWLVTLSHAAADRRTERPRGYAIASVVACGA